MSIIFPGGASGISGDQFDNNNLGTVSLILGKVTVSGTKLSSVVTTE